MAKTLLFGEEARRSMQAGVDKLANIRTKRKKCYFR